MAAYFDVEENIQQDFRIRECLKLHFDLYKDRMLQSKDEKEFQAHRKNLIKILAVKLQLYGNE